MSDFSWSDLTRVQEWMEDLWPGRGWPDGSATRVKAELAAGLSEDAAGLSEDDVWAFLAGYLESKPEHPPSPAEFIAGASQRLRDRLKEQRDSVKALPAGKPDAAGELRKYLDRIGVATWGEAVAYERHVKVGAKYWSGQAV